MGLIYHAYRDRSSLRRSVSSEEPFDPARDILSTVVNDCLKTRKLNAGAKCSRLGCKESANARVNDKDWCTKHARMVAAETHKATIGKSETGRAMIHLQQKRLEQHDESL